MLPPPEEDSSLLHNDLVLIKYDTQLGHKSQFTYIIYFEILNISRKVS